MVKAEYPIPGTDVRYQGRDSCEFGERGSEPSISAHGFAAQFEWLNSAPQASSGSEGSINSEGLKKLIC